MQRDPWGGHSPSKRAIISRNLPDGCVDSLQCFQRDRVFGSRTAVREGSMFGSRRPSKRPVTTRERVWTKPDAIARSQPGDRIDDDSKKLRTLFEKEKCLHA